MLTMLREVRNKSVATLAKTTTARMATAKPTLATSTRDQSAESWLRRRLQLRAAVVMGLGRLPFEFDADRQGEDALHAELGAVERGDDPPGAHDQQAVAHAQRFRHFRRDQ